MNKSGGSLKCLLAGSCKTSKFTGRHGCFAATASGLGCNSTLRKLANASLWILAGRANHGPAYC